MGALQEYKCPCCGGAIEFNSDVQKMKCPYCSTEFEMEVLKAFDEDLKNEQPDDMKWETEDKHEWQEDADEEVSVFVCNSCAGEIISDQNTVATSCPFCGNPVVMKGRLSGVLRPDYVIPFKVNKKEAKAALKKHLQGKRLLPKLFKEENHIDEIKGIYIPFWLFDANVNASLRYKATKVRVWSDASYDYTETRFFSVRKAGKVQFQRVPVDGSSKMPDDMMESIEPYNFAEAVDFQTAYLAGYLADKYDVNVEQSIEAANERVRYSTNQVFRSTVQGYSSVTKESESIQLENGKAQYALYPVWLLNTTWNNKQYTFAMNGQTGKFVGDLPVDKAAYWKWFGILTGASAVAVIGLTWLIHLVGGAL